MNNKETREGFPCGKLHEAHVGLINRPPTQHLCSARQVRRFAQFGEALLFYAL
jgi:hypothetical protein